MFICFVFVCFFTLLDIVGVVVCIILQILSPAFAGVSGCSIEIISPYIQFVPLFSISLFSLSLSLSLSLFLFFSHCFPISFRHSPFYFFLFFLFYLFLFLPPLLFLLFFFLSYPLICLSLVVTFIGGY